MSALLILLLAASPAPAVSAARQPGPKARELVTRANKALRGESSHCQVVLTVTTPDWKRTLELESWNKGRDMALILIQSPPRDKGSVTLRRRNELWVWMPQVEREIKIPLAMLHNPWEGSDFTYDDIVKSASLATDYDYSIITRTPEGERVLYYLEGTPKPEAPVVWGKVLVWIADYGNDGCVPVREEDYDERGDLVRRIELRDVKYMGGHLVPTTLECVPAGKPGRKTVLQYRSIEFDQPLSDSFFSLGRLRHASY